jgi:hypothetical protein
VAHRHQGPAAIQQLDVIGLGEIVILGRHPEDGDHRPSQLRPEAIRQLDGCEGLVQGEDGAPEEPGLLSRDDRHGPGLAQLLDAVADDRRGVPEGILGQQGVRTSRRR